MATKIEITSGSLLIGNPIMVSVTAESGLSNATFHRVKLIVKAALSTDGTEKEYPLSAVAGNGEIVEFDISTVLRSAASKYKYEYATMSRSYPYLAYTLKAYDEYMLNGILQETGEMKYNGGTKSYALMGAFTARERYLSASDTKDVISFTRKPVIGEVCAPWELFVYPDAVATPMKITDTITSGPSISVATLDGSGTKTYEGRTIYVDPNAKDRLLFQFVNGYGVVETISAEMLESVESSGESEVDIVTAPSSFKGVKQNIVRRADREKVYKCSSGYINREWAEWWATEFLGGDAFRRSGHSQCWVLMDGNWLPCTIEPDEDINIYDRAKPSLTHVDFEMRLL